MTNADRIRNMTDEQLAEMFSSDTYAFNCDVCKFYSYEHCERECKECKNGALEWLKLEVNDAKDRIDFYG